MQLEKQSSCHQSLAVIIFTVLEVRGLCCRLSWSMDYHFNPNPSSGRWKLWNPRKKKITSVLSARNIVVAAFWDEKDVILIYLLPKRTKVNSDQYADRWRNLNAHVHWVGPTTKICEVLLLCETVLSHTHKCAHHRGHHKFWVESCCIHTTVWHFIIRLSPVWSFDINKLWSHDYARDKALQIAMHQWLQGGESSYYWGGDTCFCSELEEDSQQW